MKTLFIVISALTISLLLSCKKNYSCSCVTTLRDPLTNETITKTGIHPISAKLKNKQAVEACNQTATQLTDHIYYYVEGSVSVSTLCTVK